MCVLGNQILVVWLPFFLLFALKFFDFSSFLILMCDYQLFFRNFAPRINKDN